MNQELYRFITEKKHHVYRPPVAEEYAARHLTPRARMTDRFVRLCMMETPHFLPGQKIAFMRTVADLPDIFLPREWEEIRKDHFIHELGYLSNLAPDYASAIERGLLAARETADSYSQSSIDALLALAEKYRAEAERLGEKEIAETLARVPAYGARTFREALQSLRILHWALWAEGEYHNTIGRFDLFMAPYYFRDIENGTLTKEEAYELICDFFLDCNIDSDLYPGVQQGDNGQSLILGGIDRDGNPVYSELSVLCLHASGEIRLIDPKINLRVDKNTPDEVYLEGSRLTAVGIGFPQYANDDVVIPALVKMGYDPKDAADYSVAACWEFIIPGVGADIANIGAVSFLGVVDRALHGALAGAKDMESFWQAVDTELGKTLDDVTGKIDNVWFIPAPIADILTHTDISKGSKYNNFGLHGTGIACAADSLAAIEKYLFTEGRRTAEQYIAAVDNDFAEDAELLSVLRNEAPKFGQNTGAAEKWAKRILHACHEHLAGRKNCRGGCWRAGTGTAMFYLWHADEIGASPDGRRKSEPFGTNYSVSLFAKLDGPVSVVDSFTVPDLTETMNGGPLTLEFQQRMFEDSEGIEKLSALVRYFLAKGGHQLQLNAVSLGTLLDAQNHPEKYSHLIVLVSVCGREVSVDELTEWLLKSADFLRKSGGVTFSGGEPLLQGEFLLAVCGRLKAEGIHLAVETCGYAPAALFDRMLDVVDYVMMDLKLMDPEQHKKYTGADNSLILTNTARLKASGKAHIFRTPLIPGITETPENRAGVLAFAGESPHEIFPYNSMAGAKYPMLGIPFAYETSATGE